MVKLEGRNQIRRFRQTAEALVSKIAPHKGVAGIVFSGGLVRGFADKYSDVDIIVFLGEKNEGLRKQIRKIGSNEQKRSRIDIDLELHLLDDFNRLKLDEIDKWDFSHTDIVFDPEGRIQKLFREKLRVSKGFWTRRIVVLGEYLKWYCCPPKENVATIAEMWVERGDLVSAHYCANYSLDLMVSMIFALNKEFMPAAKWKIFYSYSLKWLPAGYKRLIGEAITIKSLSAGDLNRRLNALRKIWFEILPKIEEETGLTPDLISKYYVQRVLHQILD